MSGSMRLPLPGPIAALLTPARMQFLRFGMVGVMGFMVDTATVYASRYWLGLYWAGILAYCVAASANWLVNRIWTFRDHAATDGKHAHAGKQWAKFLAANLVGAVLNRGTYMLLITIVPFCAAHPVVPLAAGAIMGLGVNYELSRRVVFR
ncbi:Hypothetical protein GbCGDNIH3_1448 [Granulibacter bethesdensis]|uniref:GtrA/DPMS transmembrane domain-containing protein n=1 Tax=Granulibacter bethesdensis TaxID=364410 RepID=A0AAN0REB0_9PROT|nr:GtrA family protein [Granulibacter bethesdensis]AHJ63339.1 Hypothetical protein GbCGDNIH3_1448 [Granulibacter bethesdensis]